MYVMARAPALDEAELRGLLDKARRLGHDMCKVELVAVADAGHLLGRREELDVAATAVDVLLVLDAELVWVQRGGEGLQRGGMGVEVASRRTARSALQEKFSAKSQE